MPSGWWRKSRPPKIPRRREERSPVRLAQFRALFRFSIITGDKRRVPAVEVAKATEPSFRSAGVDPSRT